MPAGPVVVRLHLEVGALTQRATPPAEQIPSRNLATLLHDGRGHRWFRRDGGAFSDFALVHVALHGHGVTAGRLPVCPKSALPYPPIVEILAIGVELGASIEDFAESAVVQALAIPGAVPEIEEALLVPAARGD